MTKRFQQWAVIGLVCAGVGSALRSGAQPRLPPPEVRPVVVRPDDPHTPKRATDAGYDNAIVASLHSLARDSWDGPACLAALLSRHPKLVDARIDRKGRKPLGDEHFTALRHAVGAGNAEAVKVLIAYKADLNADRDGWTPLHHAASGGRLEVVKLLVGAGAKVDAKTDAVPERWSTPAPSGPPNPPPFKPVLLPAIPAYTALDLAKAGKHKEVVEYLERLSR